MVVSLVALVPLLMILIGFPFAIWFMIRVTTLMQRIAIELESISRSLQSRP